MKKIVTMVVFLLGIYFANAQSSWVAPKEADKIMNPTTSNDLGASVKAGEAIFKAQCVMCHGAKGNGKGVAGAYLTPHPADFTSAKIQNDSDGVLFWKMTNGKSPMASYKDILTEKQRWSLVNYIRTFKK